MNKKLKVNILQKICAPTVISEKGKSALVNEASFGTCVAVIVIGCFAYGFTLGLARDELMGLFVAIKFPILIFTTLALNAVLNSMFAALSGSGLSFAHTLRFLLRAFAIFACFLGSLAPVFALFAWSTFDSSAYSAFAYKFILLMHVCVIAFAGALSHLTLFKILLQAARTIQSAILTFFAWLLGNLFVGAQISYIFRPFFGSPGLEIELFRENMLKGNFYYACFKIFENLFSANPELSVFIIFLCVFGIIILINVFYNETNKIKTIKNYEKQ